MGSGVRFGILGAIRVMRGDTELHPGARQQRQVLALLLARTGAVVSQTELVEALWGDGPPASAANVLHRSVGALRRLMEPGLPTRAPGTLLTRVGAGYLLRVEPATLDLLAFRDLVARARRHPDPDRAIELYRQALALWRGPCAAGVEGTHPVFLSIDGERSQAARDATDAALRAGRIRHILPALRAAAQDQPLDEALQSRLVLALAADGQRDQALAAYRTVGDRLADELGIDPGPELRAAHDTLRRTFVVSAVRSTPAQLPSGHPFFAGRDRLIDHALASIERQRAGGAAMLTLDGMPGAGTTTLAIHLAHRLAASCPDGQLYADLRGHDPRAAAARPAEVLRGFLTSLGEKPGDLPGDLAGPARRYRALLTGRRILIVLDNCPAAELIRDLLPGTPGSVVIMTSPAGVAAPGETLRVTLPSIAEARSGLALRIGADRVAAEPEAVDRIISRCGGLPLALALVAARIATVPETPLAEIAAELADGPGHLAAFGSGDTDLSTAFSWSYRRLTPATARLFRLLPLHPGSDFTVASIAALAGVSTRAARLMAGDLIGHALLEPRGERLALHRLLRAYAVELSAERDTAEERDAATVRVLDHYCRAAASAHQQEDATTWFSAERTALVDIVLGADRHRQHRVAWQLALLVEDDLRSAGRSAELQAVVRAGIAAAAADRAPAAQALLHRHLAAPPAIERPALRRSDTRAGVLLSIGDAHFESGDTGRARACWEKALTVASGTVAEQLRRRLDRMAQAA